MLDKLFLLRKKTYWVGFEVFLENFWRFCFVVIHWRDVAGSRASFNNKYRDSLKLIKTEVVTLKDYIKIVKEVPKN